jgi:hypothetical protein
MRSHYALMHGHHCDGDGIGILMTPLFMLNGDTEIDESGADENEVLAEASGMIPICITGIHEFWQKPSDAGPESRSRPGRRRRR